MANDDGTSFESISPIPIWAKELVGCDPITIALRKDREDDMEALKTAWNEAKKSGQDCYIVRDDNDRLAVWQRSVFLWEIIFYE
jgi:hypothetical protein